MRDDEREIRRLVSTWMDASKSGDVEKVLSLMTDDVVFLVTGQRVMRKSDFAAAVRAQAGADAPEFDGIGVKSSLIQYSLFHLTKKMLHFRCVY